MPEGYGLQPEFCGVNSNLQVGMPSEQCIQGHAGFKSRKPGTKAEVNAVAKRQVLIGVTDDIKGFRIIKLARVPVGSTQERHHRGSPLDFHTTPFNIFSRPVGFGTVNGALKPKHFFNRRVTERRVSFKFLQLIRMLQEGQHGIVDEMYGSFVTGKHQQKHHGNQFIFAELIALFLSLNQLRQHIITGVLSFPLNHTAAEFDEAGHIPEQCPHNPGIETGKRCP